METIMEPNNERNYEIFMKTKLKRLHCRRKFAKLEVYKK